MRQTIMDGLRLVLGDEPCVMCDREGFEGQHVEFALVACPKCKGTGKRGSGNCRNCAPPYRNHPVPAGRVRDYGQPYAAGACRYCDGARFKPAGITDALPREVIADVLDRVDVRVHLRGGELSWGEQHLGMVFSTDAGMLMSLWSTTDYGLTWRRLQDAAQAGDRDTARERVLAEIETFRQEVIARIRNDRVQACKLFTDDLVVGAEIIISLTEGGYSIITRERTVAERAVILAAVPA